MRRRQTSSRKAAAQRKRENKRRLAAVRRQRRAQRKAASRRAKKRRGSGFASKAAFFLAALVCIAVLVFTIPRIAGFSVPLPNWGLFEHGQETQEPDRELDVEQPQSGPSAEQPQSGPVVDQPQEEQPEGDAEDAADERKSQNQAQQETLDAEAERAREEEEARQRELEAYTEQLSGGYYFDQLSKDDQVKYIAFYKALTTREEQAFPNKQEEDIARIYRYVATDHPELFYVEGYAWSYYDNEEGSMVSGKFCYSEEDQERLAGELADAAWACEAGIPADADDYAKVRYVYDYLIANTAYNHAIAEDLEALPGAEAGQNAVNCLVEHSCVCAGYAAAFQLIMQDLGIPCTSISGVILEDEERHSWNAVQLDGDWYYVDSTWGDSDSDGSESYFSAMNIPLYGYLCVTSDDLLSVRSADDWQILPDCWATQDNYFVREGLMLDWADEAQIIAWGDECEYNGTILQFRCSSQEAYDEVKQLVEWGIYFSSGSGYTYTYMDEVRTVVMSIG